MFHLLNAEKGTNDEYVVIFYNIKLAMHKASGSAFSRISFSTISRLPNAAATISGVDPHYDRTS